MINFLYNNHRCTILSEQKLFGKMVCTVYIPEQDRVERVPKENLVPVEESVCQTSKEEIQAMVAAGKVFDALNNYSQTFGEDVLLAPLDSAVTPLPHQLDTLKRAIGKNPVRMLLADEVGLGKTVEAGLIIRELKLRGLIRRVLIVAPAGLAKQWISEMKVHFDEDFHLFVPSQVEAADELIRAAKSSMNLDSDQADNPYMLSDNIVCPLDAIKPIRRRKGWTKAQVDEYNMRRFLNVVHADWDLVVIDESHRVAGADDTVARFRLGIGLGESSANILLLSATPHQGKSDAFHRLLTILDSEAFPENSRLNKSAIQPYLIRHEKRSTVDGNGKPLFRPRRTHTLNICWQAHHEPQKLLYEAVTEYIREGYNMMARLTKKKRVVVGFLLSLIQRLAASSTDAIGSMLEKRVNYLKNPPQTDEDDLDYTQDELYELWDDENQEERIISLPEITSSEITQVEYLLSLVKLAQNAGPDAKAEKLIELIYDLQASEADPNLKILIFTEFTSTQKMLHDFLNQCGISSCLINGSMDMDERLASQRLFAEERRVLISTEAGGEGLNLQFCHIIVNYDMPWNPMRIEQRIGRVDRIGQKFDVQAYNMIISDTVEAHVREVIEKKLSVILADIGVDKLSDILDSGEANSAFDTVFKNAIQNEGNIDESMQQVEKVLREAARSARQFAYLYEPADITADIARDYLHHPFPYWVENMVTNYCLANHGSASKKSRDWDITLPEGKNLRHVVFSMDDLANSPAATFLSINQSDVSEILERLMKRNISGNFVTIVQSFDLPNGFTGTFGLYRLEAQAGNWQRSRIIPVFISDDGKIYQNTARTVYEALLNWSNLELTEDTADFDSELLFSSVESILAPVFDEIQQTYQIERERESRKKANLFDSRHRSLQKIGIDNIRESRIKRLARERQEWTSYFQSVSTLLPDIKLLVAIKVRGA